MSYHGNHYAPAHSAPHDQSSGYLTGDRLPRVSALPMIQTFAKPDSDYEFGSNAHDRGALTSESPLSRSYQTSTNHSNQWPGRSPSEYGNANRNFQGYGQTGIREQQTQRSARDYQRPQAVNDMAEEDTRNNDGWHGGGTTMSQMFSDTRALSNLAYASVMNFQQYQQQGDQSSSRRDDRDNSVNANAGSQVYSQGAGSLASYDQRYSQFNAQTTQASQVPQVLHRSSPDPVSLHQTFQTPASFPQNAGADRISSKSPHFVRPVEPQQAQHQSPSTPSQSQILNRPSNSSRASFNPSPSPAFPEGRQQGRGTSQKDASQQVSQGSGTAKGLKRQSVPAGLPRQVQTGGSQPQKRAQPAAQQSQAKKPPNVHHQPNQSLPTATKAVPSPKTRVPPPKTIVPPPAQAQHPLEEAPPQQSGPSSMPSYIDPTQVFNPYHREHERYKREEEQRARREPTEVSKRDDGEQVTTNVDNQTATTPQIVRPAQVKVTRETEKQPELSQPQVTDLSRSSEATSGPDSSHAVPTEDDMAEEVQLMMQRMQEMRTEDPSRFKKVWEVWKNGPGAGNMSIQSPNLTATTPQIVNTSATADAPQSQSSAIAQGGLHQPAGPSEAIAGPGPSQSQPVPPKPRSRRKKDPLEGPSKRGRAKKATSGPHVPQDIPASAIEPPTLVSVPKPRTTLPVSKPSTPLPASKPPTSLPASNPPTLSNFPFPGDSTAIRIPQNDGPAELGPTTGGASAKDKTPVATPSRPVSQNQSSQIGQKRPAGQGPVPASSGGTIWPSAKRFALAEAAEKALMKLDANQGKSLKAAEIDAMLAANPSYMELCQQLEDRGFTFNRSHFAKFLLSNVPDLGAPSPPTTASAPSPSAVPQAALNGRPAMPPHPQPASVQQFPPQPFDPQAPGQSPRPNAFSGPTPQVPQPAMNPSSTSGISPQMVHGHYSTPVAMRTFQPSSGPYVQAMGHPTMISAPLPMASNPQYTPTQVRPPKSRLGVPSTKLAAPAPGSKEANARKRNFSDLVDMTQLSDDEDEDEPPAKFPKQGAGPPTSLFQFDPVGPGPLPVQQTPGQHTTALPHPFGVPPISFGPYGGPIVPPPSNFPPHQQLHTNRGPGPYQASQSSTPQRCQKPLAKPINKEEALRKSYYDPKTIARDILIAAGRHPNQHPLNAHLSGLLGKTIDSDSDLSTFDWDSVDPGGPAMPTVEVVDILAGPPKWRLGEKRIRDPAPPKMGTFIHSPMSSDMIPRPKRREKPNSQNPKTPTLEKLFSIPTKSTGEGPLDDGVHSPRSASTPVHKPMRKKRSSSQNPDALLKRSLEKANGAANDSPLVTSDVLPNQVKKPSRLRRSTNADEEIDRELLAERAIHSMSAGPEETPAPIVETPRKRGRPSKAATLAKQSVEVFGQKPEGKSAPQFAPQPQRDSTAKPRTPATVPRLRTPSPAPNSNSKRRASSSSLPTGVPVETLSPVPRRGRPPKQPEMAADAEPRRRGRPPGSKNVKPRQSAAFLDRNTLQVDVPSPGPQFQVYACKWKDCQAELHNLATLSKHVSRRHLMQNQDTAEEGLACWWTGCRTHVVKDEKAEPKVTFNSLKDLEAHIKTDHYHPLGVQFGDGPSTNQAGKLQSDFNVSRFAYDPTQAQWFPSPSPVPSYGEDSFPIHFDPHTSSYSHTDEQTAADDRTHFLSDEHGQSVMQPATHSSIETFPPDTLILAPTGDGSNLPRQAFLRAHNKDKTDHKRVAVETLLSLQKEKERVGPLLDRGGCTLATPEWRAKFAQDLRINHVVDGNF